jgi:hypothetical protein
MDTILKGGRKNPLRSRNGFMVVDKVIEISNLGLLRDVVKMLDLVESEGH